MGLLGQTTILGNPPPAIIGIILQAAPQTPHRTTPFHRIDRMWVPQRLAQLRVILTGAKALLGQHDDLSQENLQRSDPWVTERTPKKPEGSNSSIATSFGRVRW